MRLYICINSKYDNVAALKLARKYSPNTELIDNRTLVFDVVGKQAKDFSSSVKSDFDEENFLRIAASDNLATAILIAQNSNKKITYSERSDLSALYDLPVSVLNHKRDFVNLMGQWGISNLREFSQLPENEMVARFGNEVTALLRKAAGTDYRLSNWDAENEPNSWTKELEGEIETIEPLNFILTAGIGDIFKHLDGKGLSTQSAKLILSGRKLKKSYRIKVVFPNKREKVWLRQILNKVELSPPKFGVSKVYLEFTACKPRTIQNDLYSGVILEPENLDLIVSKLKKVVGLNKIGIPVLKDSWSRGFGLRQEINSLLRESYEGITEEDIYFNFFYLPELVRSQVHFEFGKPRSISLNGEKFLIVNAGGPWRKDVEWFEEEKMTRDEWDVETESGELYRICLDTNGEFFVEGGYD